jgi:hypothetical protein
MTNKSKVTTNKKDQPTTEALRKLTREEMALYFKLPQPEAAKRLGVSLSSLKRRFYELYRNRMEGAGETKLRWPYSCYKKNVKKTKLKYILNPVNKPTKMLDPHTIHILKLSFQSSLKLSSTPVPHRDNHTSFVECSNVNNNAIHNQLQYCIFTQIKS